MFGFNASTTTIEVSIKILRFASNGMSVFADGPLGPLAPHFGKLDGVVTKWLKEETLNLGNGTF